ncbi:integrin alpha-L, partial [Pelobates cultripes]
AVIHVMFDVVPNVTWPDTVNIKAEVMSINETNSSLSDNTKILSVPVLHPINVISKGLDKSTKYLNFSDPDQSHVVTHIYQVTLSH